KLSQRNAGLYYRDQYCNVHHSPSDPFSGTPLEHRLEGYIDSGEHGSIHPSAQANYFYDPDQIPRVHIEIEFPLEEVKPLNWSDEPFNVLIVGYGNDGHIVARQSDGDCCSSHYERLSNFFNLPDVQRMFTPVRYEAQIELPPGKYKFAIAASKGTEFGITDVLLTIPDYDKKQLGISSIALCKRFREAGSPPAAKDFVLLVSQNYEFTPAASHAFRPSDPVVAYFELYEPSGAQTETPPRFRMKITNTKTGHMSLDTGPMSAAQWTQAGKSMIPLAVQLVLEKLVADDYKLEIQAWDSAGNAT